MRVIDSIAYCGLIGGAVSLILATNQGGIDTKGNVENEHIIAARLRLNLEMARDLRDRLHAQIELMSPPSGIKAN